MGPSKRSFAPADKLDKIFDFFSSLNDSEVLFRFLFFLDFFLSCEVSFLGGHNVNIGSQCCVPRSSAAGAADYIAALLDTSII